MQERPGIFEKENKNMNISITHIAIYAKDIEAMRDFYVKYFGAKSNEKYVNTKGFSSYFLTFDSGARLEIMAHEELEHREVMDRVNGISHIAFSVGSRENVISLTERIAEDGYKVYSQPRQTGDGYFESCIADLEGNRIEITQ